MQNRVIVVAVLAGLIAFAPHAVRADGTTSPGKKAVYVDQTGETVSTVSAALTPALTATIEKGKKKTVLEIDLTITDIVRTSMGMGVAPFVNGFSDVVLPHPGTNIQNFVLTTCDASTWVKCTTNGHFWVDIDAAEAAHAGMFVGQPLVIEMQALADVSVTGAEASRYWTYCSH